MATTTPLAYNTGGPIGGTSQVGDLAVGTSPQDYSTSPGGVPWWMGPDEELGYVIAVPVSGNTQPTPLGSTWDANYVGTGNVLSSGNTVVTNNAVNASVLGTQLVDGNDKIMFSIRVNQGINGVIGFGQNDMNINSYVGSDNKSFGLNSQGEYLFYGAVQDSGLPTWGSPNDIVDVTIKLGVGSGIWFRVNGGGWNGTRNENPASGSSSLGVPIVNPNLYPGLTPYPVNIQGKVTFLSEPVYSVPSGFTFIGGVFASVGFYQSTDLTDNSFIELTNNVFTQSFSSATEASTWLTNNGYWNSYGGPVLYLDANNLSSYPGTGTTWYDISGNGNDVTMVNSSSIAWNNSSPVYFSTGANGWFNNPSGSNLPIGNANYTLIIWVQLGSTWVGNGLMSIGSFGTTNQSNAFRTASTNVLLNYWWANDLAGVSSVSPTDWFNAVATYDGTTRSIWVNGTLVGSDIPVGHNVITNALQIAKTGGNEFLNGNVGEVLIYDRGLTSGEILGIFNATKSRYGL